MDIDIETVNEELRRARKNKRSKSASAGIADEKAETKELIPGGEKRSDIGSSLPPSLADSVDESHKNSLSFLLFGGGRKVVLKSDLEVVSNIVT
jgi:hypothetical protein